ncbi:MAG: hypothetical protein JRN15_08310 [Nitrososphaerota archaeon]|nr:hypothetical protein [Nitrososphaerota archaeon]
MQKISLISTLTLLALVSVGSVVTLAVNPFSNGGHASAPQLNIPQMNSVNSTSNGDTSSSSTSTSTHTSTYTSTSTSTTNSSGLLTNSTGLLTSPPTNHSGGDDGSGDDGSSSCGVTTQTSLTTTVTTTMSCTRYDD